MAMLGYSNSCLDFGVFAGQLLNCVWLFAVPWTAAYQVLPLSPGVCSNSCSLSQWCYLTVLMLCHPLLLLPLIFPSIRVFSSKLTLHIRCAKYWSFCFSTVIPMNIQGWFPFGWTGWISLLPKELSRVISSTTVQKHQFFWRLFTGFNNSMALCSSDTLFPNYPSQSFAVGALLSGSYDGKIRVLMIRAMFIMF